jgi:hypothetical protein
VTPETIDLLLANTKRISEAVADGVMKTLIEAVMEYKVLGASNADACGAAIAAMNGAVVGSQRAIEERFPAYGGTLQ